MPGSTFKRCACRDETTGRQWGRRCPRLYRNGRRNSEHGTWQYQIDLPPAPGGKRRTLRQGPFATQREAEQALGEVTALLELPDPTDPDEVEQIVAVIQTSIRAKTPLPAAAEMRRRLAAGVAVTDTPTVEQWLTEWLTGRRTLRANTYRSYESHVRLYLIPHLGTIRLDRLRVAHLNAMFTAIEEFNDLIRTARDSNNPDLQATVKGRRIVEAASQQRIRATLRKALNDAIPRGLITTNPARHVELSPGRRPKPLVWTAERVARWQKTSLMPGKVMVWTPAQTGQFLDHIHHHRLYALFHLVAFRGLRRGEVCGLRDEDIHAAAGEMSVRTQRVQIGWHVEEGAPKTDAGERTLALDTESLRAIHANQAIRDAERALLGNDWADDSGLLFTEPDGTPLHPAKVTDLFTALVTDAGLPPIRLHDLRHGAATLALAAGVDIKVVQDMLGHSSIAITADTYTSVLPQVARHAADAIAALVPRNNTPQH